MSAEKKKIHLVVVATDLEGILGNIPEPLCFGACMCQGDIGTPTLPSPGRQSGLPADWERQVGVGDVRFLSAGELAGRRLVRPRRHQTLHAVRCHAYIHAANRCAGSDFTFPFN